MSFTFFLNITASTIADAEYTIITIPRACVIARDPRVGFNIITMPQIIDKTESKNVKNQ